MRGLANESTDRLPTLLGKLEDMLERIDARLSTNAASAKPANDVVELRHQAFIIETLLILRYLVKSDLRLGGEIGRKLQKAVGDVRVEGT